MKRRHWTDKEIETLRDLYPETPMPEIERRLKRTKKSIYMKVKSLGLKRSSAFRKSEHSGCILPGQRRGKITEFKPGQPPHNKGKKFSPPGSEKGHFKEGHTPANALPVGSEYVSKDGIRYRKISETGRRWIDWRPVHSYLWEKHRGQIPRGHIVVFRNGNRDDIRIENLELITRAENMRRNSIHQLPEELREVCLLRGVINRKIRERRENEK